MSGTPIGARTESFGSKVRIISTGLKHLKTIDNSLHRLDHIMKYSQAQANKCGSISFLLHIFYLNNVHPNMYYQRYLT